MNQLQRQAIAAMQTSTKMVVYASIEGLFNHYDTLGILSNSVPVEVLRLVDRLRLAIKDDTEVTPRPSEILAKFQEATNG